MIKEIDFKTNNAGDFLYTPVELNVQMQQPFMLGIDILHQAEYFHTHLTNTDLVLTNAVPDADWIAVSRWTKLVCVSKRFKDVFEDKLTGTWYETSTPDYFIFLLNNCVQGLDLEKTKIVNNKVKDYWYESLEHETFLPTIESQQFMFTIPQEPNRKLITTQFEDMYNQHAFTGIQFYKDINFRRANGAAFDLLRFNTYDDTGNSVS